VPGGAHGPDPQRACRSVQNSATQAAASLMISWRIWRVTVAKGRRYARQPKRVSNDAERDIGLPRLPWRRTDRAEPLLGADVKVVPSG
jgi:hypothetical protein